MKFTKSTTPGGGLVLLALVLGFSLAFFAWGFSTPRLDVIQRLSIELRLGRKEPLRLDELRLFQEALCDRPKLADDFLDGGKLAIISAHHDGLIAIGHAYLIRAHDDETGIVVSALGGKKKKKEGLAIRARTVAEEMERTLEPDETTSWVPKKDDCATLIEVRAAKGSFTVRATP